MQEDEKKVRINPFIVGGVLFALLVVVLLIVSLRGVLRGNQYGEETIIDNFATWYSEVPQQERELIFNQLYVVILDNLSEGEVPPESGALIREGTAEQTFDEDTQVYDGNFVVDIESVEQSYGVEFRWSPVEDNENLDGYPVVFTCLPKRLQIYENQNSCVGTMEIVPFWENAFQLDYIFGDRTSAKIRDRIGAFLVYLYDEEDEYVVEIDAPSLERDREQPDLTYSFDAVLNQEIDFNVVVRTDAWYGDEYISFYVKVGDDEKGFVMTDNESMVGELSTWLKGVAGDNDLVIEVDLLD